GIARVQDPLGEYVAVIGGVLDPEAFQLDRTVAHIADSHILAVRVMSIISCGISMHSGDQQRTRHTSEMPHSFVLSLRVFLQAQPFFIVLKRAKHKKMT